MLNESSRRASTTGLAIGALVLAGIIVLTFYPGVMTNDSHAVLKQARTLELTDWHPPIMALIWRGLDAIVEGPALMLVAQALLYAGAVAKLCAKAFPMLAHRLPPWLLVLLVGAFPPVFALTGMMWKDIWMSSFLLLGLAYVFQMASADHQRRRVRAFLLLLACCVLATTLRHNAMAATAGLLAGGCYYLLAIPRPWLRLLSACSLGVLLAVGFALAVTSINRMVATPTNPTTTILLHDIAGTLLRTPDPASASRQLLIGHPALSDRAPAKFLQQVRDGYDPASANGILKTSRRKNAPFDIIVYRPSHDAESVRGAWKDIVVRHPSAYLRHRLATFRCLIQLCDIGPWKKHSYVLNPDYITSENAHPLQSALRATLLSSSLARLYAPWLWLTIVLAGGLVGLRNARARLEPLLFMGLSGAGLASSLLLSSPIESYRYMHWVILLGWLMCWMLVERRINPRV
ncbi:hypothetical protein [Lysobacter sp. A289]